MRVVVLFPRALKEPQGLSKVVNMFATNAHIFKENGVDLKVISRDTIIGQTVTYNQAKNSSYSPCISNIRRNLMDVLEWASQKYNFFARYTINHAFKNWSKKAVDYYESIGETADILLFHDVFTCAEYLKRNSAVNHQKTICVVHSIGIPMYGLKQQYPKLVGTKYFADLENDETLVMEKTDAYGFVSYKSEENFLSCKPDFDKKRLFFVHNGVPNSHNILKVKSNSRIKEIVCVGGINKHKGQERIIDAMIDLSAGIDTLPDIHFTFIGSGELIDKLKEKVSSNKLNDYFDFVGQVNNVDDYLVKSDIFILPSSNDGLPMAIIEAMRAFLPIVSTKVGGIPELIDDKVTGLLIDASKDGVKSFIQNIDTYDWYEMGKAARGKYLKEFAIESMVSKYCKIFNQIYEK